MFPQSKTLQYYPRNFNSDIAQPAITRVLSSCSYAVEWPQLCSPKFWLAETGSGLKPAGVGTGAAPNSRARRWLQAVNLSLPSSCRRLGRGKYGHHNLLGHVCPKSDGGNFNRLPEDKSHLQAYTGPFRIMCHPFCWTLCSARSSTFSFSLRKRRGDTHPRGLISVYGHWTSHLSGDVFIQLQHAGAFMCFYEYISCFLQIDEQT